MRLKNCHSVGFAKRSLDTNSQGHQGITKCRKRARQAVWWLNIGAQIENLLATCITCSRRKNSSRTTDFYSIAVASTANTTYRSLRMEKSVMPSCDRLLFSLYRGCTAFNTISWNESLGSRPASVWDIRFSSQSTVLCDSDTNPTNKKNRRS